VLLAVTFAPSPALAQRFPFARTFEAAGVTKIQVSTGRGKIEIVAGAPGQIEVGGAVTVRVGWDVPWDAEKLARQVAASPPIEVAGETLRLHDPAERDAQRAVTVNYRLRVPANITVDTTSESGETTVSGLTAAVAVRTQSGVIAVKDLAGTVTVGSGSGAVSAANVAGPLTVTTSSSSFNGSGLTSLTIRTQSGEVKAALAGSGDVDVQTGSSAISLTGVRGALTAETRSGRITVQGAPSRDWSASTQSSSVSFDIARGTGAALDVASRSGSIDVAGAEVQGTVAKRSVKGTVNGGGSLIRVATGSGSIRLEFDRSSSSR
jgi:DUF4097 and DUF4098 domain-containing protein YvlB